MRLWKKQSGQNSITDDQNRIGALNKKAARWKTAAVVLMAYSTMNFVTPAYAVADGAAIVMWLETIGRQITETFFSNLLKKVQEKLSSELQKSFGDNMGQLGALNIKLGTADPARLNKLLKEAAVSQDPEVSAKIAKAISPPNGMGPDLNKAANANDPETDAFSAAWKASRIELEKDYAIKATKNRQFENDKGKNPSKPDPSKPPNKTAAGETIPPGGAPVAQDLADIAAEAAKGNNEDHKEGVNRGVAAMASEHSATADEDILLNIFKSSRKKDGSMVVDKGEEDIPEGYNFKDKETQLAIARFLTAPPVISAELAPAIGKSFLDKDRASVLSDVMLGVSALPLQSRAQLNRTNARSQQLRLFTRFARLQIARQAVYASMSPEQHKVRNDEFVSYIARPSDMASAKSTDGYRNVMIINLLRGNNLFLMRMREKQLEENRLLGVILTSMMEANRRDNQHSVGQASSSPSKPAAATP